MHLPGLFKEHMKELLHDEYEDYLAAMERSPFSGLRVNTQKISVEDFLKISPFHLTPVPWCTDGFTYSTEERPGTHAYWNAGLYYLQEPSAMCPAEILPVKEGDCILDACAAPGGKSTKLGVRLNHTGMLVCNDLSSSRQAASMRNMERFGIDRSYITGENALELAGRCREYFDAVLLDAPCSGEGMFRKDPSLMKAWNGNSNDEYSQLQKRLITACADMLKPGGVMVYSTCTFSVKEDEEVILHLLQERPQFQLLDIPDGHGLFAHGILQGTEKCVRLYPHRLNGEGHFAALLGKGGGESVQTPAAAAASEKLPDFFELVSKDFSRSRIVRKKEKFYALPDILPPVNNLRSLRTGLYLGEEKRNGFEPSQALAMALRESEFANTVSFESSDIRVEKYLRGETVKADTPVKGWVLVCVDHFPLGFAKASGGVLKNKIDPGWRKI
ncbi:MAG: RsmF rRNA methyltransferase first C-terminal domain-containing protein [Solobacterium sp.]|nr:RsmF rRNA methyltransferase first C-terminal domain-containing protein [Solobacterium sp.]